MPMYRTSVDTVPAGRFRGKLVVSMRPFKPADAIRAIEITVALPARARLAGAYRASRADRHRRSVAPVGRRRRPRCATTSCRCSGPAASRRSRWCSMPGRRSASPTRRATCWSPTSRTRASPNINSSVDHCGRGADRPRAGAGHRPLRLHADPADDAGGRRLLDRRRRLAGGGELPRLPGRRAVGDGAARARRRARSGSRSPSPRWQRWRWAFVEGFAAWLALRTLAGIASAWVLIHMGSWCAQRLARLGQAGPERRGVRRRQVRA